MKRLINFGSRRLKLYALNYISLHFCFLSMWLPSSKVLESFWIEIADSNSVSIIADHSGYIYYLYICVQIVVQNSTY